MSAYFRMMEAIQDQRKALLVHSTDDFLVRISVTYRSLVSGPLVMTPHGPVQTFKRRPEGTEDTSSNILEKLRSTHNGVKDSLKIQQGEVLERAKVVALILGFESPIYEYERPTPNQPGQK